MLSYIIMCFAQAFKLLNGRMIRRQPLRAAYLQCFPSKKVLAQMAEEKPPHPTTVAANNAAAEGQGHQAPTAPIRVPKGSLSPAAKVCCSSSKLAMQLLLGDLSAEATLLMHSTRGSNSWTTNACKAASSLLQTAECRGASSFASKRHLLVLI